MTRRKVIPLTSLVLFLFICFGHIFAQEVSDTKMIAFTKNVVVKKYKMGEVQAEPYTVKRGDNLWVILVKNYEIKDRQFDGIGTVNDKVGGIRPRETAAVDGERTVEMI